MKTNTWKSQILSNINTEIVGTELCFWVSYDHILIFQLQFNAIYAYINEKTVQHVTSVRQLNWKAHSQTGTHA
jgi:hypothetical protein